MIMEDYKRISFKEIIEILEPDLSSDFKATSFFHNDFKKRQTKKVKSNESVNRNHLLNNNLLNRKIDQHLDTYSYN